PVGFQVPRYWYSENCRGNGRSPDDSRRKIGADDRATRSAHPNRRADGGGESPGGGRTGSGKRTAGGGKQTARQAPGRNHGRHRESAARSGDPRAATRS